MSFLSGLIQKRATAHLDLHNVPIRVLGGETAHETAGGSGGADVATVIHDLDNARPPEVIMQNIVATVDLQCPLDLKKIVLTSRNAEYNPKRFAACVMRLRDPRTTALMFSSGKMVCTGAKSEEASHSAARKFARILQKIGFSVKFTNFHIQNVVGSSTFPFPIQLERLHIESQKLASYEPELFPGLVYRLVEPRVVVLVFISGKVVFTGAKKKADIDEAMRLMWQLLPVYRKV